MPMWLDFTRVLFRSDLIFKQKTAYEMPTWTGVQTCALPISPRLHLISTTLIALHNWAPNNGLTSPAPSLDITSTKGILGTREYKQNIIGSSGQSRPAAIASLTACAKTRSASNLASSVKMPGCGAGDSATVPEIRWPSITALRWNVFLFGFFDIFGRV